MSEWSCIKCKYRDIFEYDDPCYGCVDGDEFELAEEIENYERTNK